MKKFKSLAEAEVAYQALEASSADTATQLAAAQEQARVNFQSLKDSQAQVEALQNIQSVEVVEDAALKAERDDLKAKLEASTSQISALTEDKTKLTNQLAEAQNISVEKINAEAARIVAASGVPPVAIGASAVPGEPSKPVLKGSAKTTDYFARRMPKQPSGSN